MFSFCINIACLSHLYCFAHVDKGSVTMLGHNFFEKKHCLGECGGSLLYGLDWKFSFVILYSTEHVEEY